MLATHLYYGGENLANDKIINDVFLYDQTQLAGEAAWEDLADFLGMSVVEHDLFHSSRIPHERPWAKQARINICDDVYDDLRRLLLDISLEMSVWLMEYLLPVARDPNRADVVVADPNRFADIVMGYRKDPCRRLVRNHTNQRWQLLANLTYTAEKAWLR